MFEIGNNLPASANTNFALSEIDSTMNLAKDRSVREMAENFEAMLLSQLLKEMRQTLEEGLFAGDAGDVQGGLFDFFLGKHLAEAGGVGLAKMIQEYVNPKLQPREPSPHDVSPANRSALSR